MARQVDVYRRIRGKFWRLMSRGMIACASKASSSSSSSFASSMASFSSSLLLQRLRGLIVSFADWAMMRCSRRASSLFTGALLLLFCCRCFGRPCQGDGDCPGDVGQPKSKGVHGRHRRHMRFPNAGAIPYRAHGTVQAYAGKDASTDFCFAAVLRRCPYAPRAVSDPNRCYGITVLQMKYYLYFPRSTIFTLYVWSVFMSVYLGTICVLTSVCIVTSLSLYQCFIHSLHLYLHYICVCLSMCNFDLCLEICTWDKRPCTYL